MMFAMDNCKENRTRRYLVIGRATEYEASQVVLLSSPSLGSGSPSDRNRRVGG